MGLDTTPDCWSGAYSSFSEWRTRIAFVAGKEVKRNGYGDLVDYVVPEQWRNRDVAWGDWPEGQPKDPLDVLLCHSDCDGFVRSRHCAPLADRLEGLLALIPVTDEDQWSRYSTRARTQQFISGLHEAHSKGIDVKFH